MESEHAAPGFPSRSDGREPRAESESSPPKLKQMTKPSMRCPFVSVGHHAHWENGIEPLAVSSHTL